MFVLFFFIHTIDIFYYRGIVVSIRRRGCFSDETHFLLPLHPSFAFVPPNVNVLIVSPQSISLRPPAPTSSKIQYRVFLQPAVYGERFRVSPSPVL